MRCRIAAAGDREPRHQNGIVAERDGGKVDPAGSGEIVDEADGQRIRLSFDDGAGRRDRPRRPFRSETQSAEPTGTAVARRDAVVGHGQRYILVGALHHVVGLLDDQQTDFIPGGRT